MKNTLKKLKPTKLFKDFFESEKSGGLTLIACTAVSLIIANSVWASNYEHFWHTDFAGHGISHWINDGLMTIFFLLIGLELEREIYQGELSNIKDALLPIFAAIGGMLLPAGLFLLLTYGTEGQAGIGIPMATDIAFALGVLAILGQRVPLSLKIFVVAFAVIDDLGAIVLIALFYTAQVSVYYLVAALLVWALLLTLNRYFRVMSLLLYLIGGAVMWVLLLQSGIHATVTGVLLAFAIPFSSRSEDQSSPSHRLEHLLHKPAAFLILPIFALANTGIVIAANWADGLSSPNSLGVMVGLVAGKPAGIVLFCMAAVALGLCRLPEDLRWRHIAGAGMLGGIGFTMSIFITNLAFEGDADMINGAKMAILLASIIAGLLGFLWLRLATTLTPAPTQQT
ncbi:MAG: Na+/H+ antiporter NhaA [Burkholderiaceae bacterium]